MIWFIIPILNFDILLDIPTVTTIEYLLMNVMFIQNSEMKKFWEIREFGSTAIKNMLQVHPTLYITGSIVEFWDTCMQLFEYNGALVHSNIYCWVLNESRSYSYDRDYWLLEINGWMIYLHGRVAMRNNH